jgi:hypothetical protein
VVGLIPGCRYGHCVWASLASALPVPRGDGRDVRSGLKSGGGSRLYISELHSSHVYLSVEVNVAVEHVYSALRITRKLLYGGQSSGIQAQLDRFFISPRFLHFAVKTCKTKSRHWCTIDLQLYSTHYHRFIFSTRSTSPPQAAIMRASKITRSIAALRTTGPRSRAVSSLRPGSIGTQSSSSSLLSSSSPRNQHGRLISSPGAGSSQSMASRLLSTSSPARSSSGEIAIK